MPLSEELFPVDFASERSNVPAAKEEDFDFFWMFGEVDSKNKGAQ